MSNCNCLDETSKALIEHYKPVAGDDVQVECLGKAIVFGESVESKLFIPFRIKGSKKGFSSAKGTVTNMFFSYCPFCGEKVGAA
ncbi:hypothetical protein ACIPF8_19135 [Collimonas sp. NPDC087041]|uniref:hypothetical protein n=1 Tax=Collimonas sp. NPDC087041 TaxID=3363960 RepID=UPI0037FE3E12